MLRALTSCGNMKLPKGPIEPYKEIKSYLAERSRFSIPCWDARMVMLASDRDRFRLCNGQVAYVSRSCCGHVAIVSRPCSGQVEIAAPAAPADGQRDLLMRLISRQLLANDHLASFRCVGVPTEHLVRISQSLLGTSLLTIELQGPQRC